MQGARRRPYVDMVKEGNAAAGAPQRGAGAPVSGDATAEARMRAAVNAARSVRFGVPLRLGVRSRVREQRAAPENESFPCSGLRPVPHHRSGDRGRGAPTPTGAGTAPPSAARPGRNPQGRGAAHPHSGGCASPLGEVEKRRHKCLLRGAFLCREPSQYRHIASGSPPRTASHIASVAHAPSYETGSNVPNQFPQPDPWPHSHLPAKPSPTG
jgi:hypothetical protein